MNKKSVFFKFRIVGRGGGCCSSAAFVLSARLVKTLVFGRNVKRLLGKSGRRREDNIRFHLYKIAWDGED
jgi:hypothetical protein